MFIIFIFRNEFVSNRTKIMIICMVNKAYFSIRVKTLNQSLLRSLLSFMNTCCRIGFIKHVRSPTTTINSTQKTIPFQQCIISCKASKIYRIDVLIKCHFVITNFCILISFFFIERSLCALTIKLLSFFGQLSCLFESFSHILLNRAIAN